MIRAMRSLVAFALVVVALSATARPALAQDDAHALELFQESEKAYRLGHFDDAARLLVEARKFKREPVLLYNLARAYDGAGKKREAIQAFEEYLHEDPSAKDGPGIRARVATLKKEADEKDALLAQKAAAPEASLSPPLERPKELRNPSVAPWIVVGAGTLLLGGGIGVGLAARSRHEDAVAAPSQKNAASLQAQAESRATASTVILIAGGVIAGAGLTWGIFDLAASGGSKTTAYVSPFGAGVRGAF